MVGKFFEEEVTTCSNPLVGFEDLWCFESSGCCLESKLMRSVPSSCQQSPIPGLCQLQTVKISPSKRQHDILSQFSLNQKTCTP